MDVDSILYDRDLNELLAGGEGFDDDLALTGDEVWGVELDGILGARDAGSALQRMSRWNVPANSRMPQQHKVAAVALQQGARKVLGVAENIRAKAALRPNSYCPIQSPPIAAGASVTLTIQPGGGNGTWEFMGFQFEDGAAQFFTVTSLTIAGQPVNYGSVSASAGVISAQGISVGVFDTRNPDKFNLTPWMGITFTNQQSIVMTVANSTNAADVGGGQYTLKGAVLTRVNPCDVELPGAREQIAGYALNQAARRSMAALPGARRARYGFTG
jgi:hypothetical protein